MIDFLSEKAENVTKRAKNPEGFVKKICKPQSIWSLVVEVFGLSLLKMDYVSKLLQDM